jgi:hypothetical protein
MIRSAMLLGMLSVATAFHSCPSKSPFAMIAQAASREISLVGSSCNYSANNRKPLSKRTRTTTTTGLLYSNDVSSSSSSSQEQRWWKNLFPESATSTLVAPSKSSINNNEQESVDQYLLFLEKRYRRLHSEEQKKKKKLQHSKPMVFSAMDWLLNEGSSATEQGQPQSQQDDALYVLGVAGLASQKLLQKHHLHAALVNSETVHASDNLGAIDVAVNQEEELSSVTISKSHLFIKTVLVPIVKVIYVLQRQRQMLIQKVQQRVATVASKTAQRMIKPFAKGPKALLQSMMDIGGGRRNVALTVACAYTAVLLLQPILQAIMTPDP